MEVPVLRIPGITHKAMLLRIFTCNCEGREGRLVMSLQKQETDVSYNSDTESENVTHDTGFCIFVRKFASRTGIFRRYIIKGKITGPWNIGQVTNIYFEVKGYVTLTHYPKVWCSHYMIISVLIKLFCTSVIPHIFHLFYSWISHTNY